MSRKKVCPGSLGQGPRGSADRRSGRDGALHFATKSVVSPLEVLAVPLSRWQHQIRDRARRFLWILELAFGPRCAVLIAPRKIGGGGPPDALLHLGVHVSGIERVRGHARPVELEGETPRHLNDRRLPGRVGGPSGGRARRGTGRV